MRARNAHPYRWPPAFVETNSGECTQYLTSPSSWHCTVALSPSHPPSDHSASYRCATGDPPSLTAMNLSTVRRGDLRSPRRASLPGRLVEPLSHRSRCKRGGWGAIAPQGRALDICAGDVDLVRPKLASIPPNRWPSSFAEHHRQLLGHGLVVDIASLVASTFASLAQCGQVAERTGGE
jgi:hypothetical protein